MYCVQDDEGELALVKDLNEQFTAAARVRDALPKDARGAWDEGAWQAHVAAGGDFDTLPPNATEAYREAQAKVHMLYEAMQTADRRYFRLNIWGMQRYRQVMMAFNVARDDYGTPDWPKLDKLRTCWLLEHVEKTDLAEDSAGLLEPGERVLERRKTKVMDPERWFQEWSEEPEYRSEDYIEPEGDALAQFEQHKAAHEAHLSWRPDPQEDFRIALHKFGSNDGWHVTPEEAFFAGNTLKTIRDAEDERFNAILGANGFESEDSRRYFDQWIDYLLLASKRGGFRVH